MFSLHLQQQLEGRDGEENADRDDDQDDEEQDKPVKKKVWSVCLQDTLCRQDLTDLIFLPM